MEPVSSCDIGTGAGTRPRSGAVRPGRLVSGKSLNVCKKQMMQLPRARGSEV